MQTQEIHHISNTVINGEPCMVIDHGTHFRMLRQTPGDDPRNPMSYDCIVMDSQHIFFERWKIGRGMWKLTRTEILIRPGNKRSVLIDSNSNGSQLWRYCDLEPCDPGERVPIRWLELSCDAITKDMGEFDTCDLPFLGAIKK